MALKTFNLNEETYKKYSNHCKKQGISMSKQVEKFIAQELTRIDASPAPSLPTQLTTNPPSELKTSRTNHPMSKFC